MIKGSSAFLLWQKLHVKGRTCMPYGCLCWFSKISKLQIVKYSIAAVLSTVKTSGACQSLKLCLLPLLSSFTCHNDLGISQSQHCTVLHRNHSHESLHAVISVSQQSYILSVQSWQLTHYSIFLLPSVCIAAQAH